MSSITITGQAATVMSFSMPSVQVQYPAAPAQVSTGMLPVMFTRNMRLENTERNLTFGSGSLNTINFEICVLVEAVRQGTQFESYELTRAIMDELAAALEVNAATLYLDFYNILETFETAGETVFFAVVAEVRTSG